MLNEVSLRASTSTQISNTMDTCMAAMNEELLADAFTHKGSFGPTQRVLNLRQFTHRNQISPDKSACVQECIHRPLRPCSCPQRPPEERVPKQSLRFTLMQENQAC